MLVGHCRARRLLDQSAWCPRLSPHDSKFTKKSIIDGVAGFPGHADAAGRQMARPRSGAAAAAHRHARHVQRKSHAAERCDCIVRRQGFITVARQKNRRPGDWTVTDGVALSRQGRHPVTTNEFGDIQLHLEFREPTPPKGERPGPRQQRRVLDGPLRDSGA